MRWAGIGQGHKDDEGGEDVLTLLRDIIMGCVCPQVRNYGREDGWEHTKARRHRKYLRKPDT